MVPDAPMVTTTIMSMNTGMSMNAGMSLKRKNTFTVPAVHMTTIMNMNMIMSMSMSTTSMSTGRVVRTNMNRK